jgi:hypothetical protein
MPRAAIALFASSTGIAVVHAAASWTKPRRSETEILETLYLLFFLGLRADIGPFENRVSILFAGYHHPFHGLWEIAVIAVSAVVLALLMLVILKAFSALSRFSFIQSSSHPMDRWYREVIRKEYWGLLYLCVIPIFISASIPSTIKRGSWCSLPFSRQAHICTFSSSARIHSTKNGDALSATKKI